MSADPAAAPSDSTSSSRHELIRVLGLGMAIAMVVGNTIGSGIFRKPGLIAMNSDSFPVIIVGWIVGGLVCLAGALCFAELAAMLPRAGGMYNYLSAAYGKPVAFLYGWSEFFFGTPASCGALAIMILETLAPLFGIKSQLSEITLVVGSILLIWCVAFVNVRGAIWGGSVQGITTVIKAGSVALIALLPLVLLLFGSSALRWEHFASHFDPAAFNPELATLSREKFEALTLPKYSTLGAQMAAVLLAVMWAYNGWDGVAPVAAEVRDPHRNIPRALLMGVGILILVYVGANMAYHGALSMTELISTPEKTAQTVLRKQLGVFGGSWAEIGVTMLTVVIAISSFGAINSNLMQSPRVAYALGHDGVFFQKLGHVHASFRTPAIAICTQAAMASLMVVGARISKYYVDALKTSDLFDILTDYVIFSASVFLLLSVIGVLILRFKHPEWERPYRTLGYPVTPLLFVGFYVWFLPTAYRLESFSAHVAAILILLGLPAYYLYAAFQRRASAA
jgi:APA family basic amino acid/polyamine antiporter